jgi:hypothetical protein
VTPNGLSALAGGTGVIVSRVVEGGHIAVLSSSPWSTSTSASIYSVTGEPLAQIPLGAAVEVALSGKLLIVLNPAPTPSVQIYSVYTGYVGNSESLHVLDPAAGADAKVARVKGHGRLQEWAVGSRGVVYAVNSGQSGKLEFVPAAKLRALLG